MSERAGPDAAVGLTALPPRFAHEERELVVPLSRLGYFPGRL
ncbi:hypothetical protein ACFFQW_19335 [Umezawaea endophytica]|uniref:Uncharacterized protein n=1 Tax=Umezawaea endophytica TaxID=1654476 RepID=A0A9X2VMY5_9PSEU|nr:hypothetical protein [Umezawaea endophytica]MCS7479560.1 hypothetical protein [Umezawaea endophytica]